MSLPVLQAVRDTACQRCDLHAGCTSVCVPTTTLDGRTTFRATKPRAIVIVGEAPGASEDRVARPFVGKSGTMLRKMYVNHFNLESRADVYLSNAVRCRPPQNDTPSTTQLKSCQGFLLADLITLQTIYKEVIVLVVGGTAVSSVLGTSLTEAFSKQGCLTDFRQLLATTIKKYGPIKDSIVAEWPAPCRVFATYHPSYLIKNPTMGLSMHAHVRLLVDYLDGRTSSKVEPASLAIEIAPLPPTYPIDRLSYDIETYGLFTDSPRQTQYHPRKMEAYDGIARSRIIRTASLTHRDTHGELKHAFFDMQNPSHRRKLWSWFDHCRKNPDFQFLLGQNISFDLVVTRYCYPESKAWLNHHLPIMDTIVANYLHNETRPEKSLKNLAPLFNITTYEIEGDVRRFADAMSARFYNCQDTAATLLLMEKLEEEIGRFYGVGTGKLSPFCMRWYSDLLWLVTWMTETGVCMDVPGLNEVMDSYLHRQQKCLDMAQQQWGLPFRGKGSKTAQRTIIQGALDELERLGIETPELTLTDKTKEIATDAENRNALLDLLPRNSEPARQLRLYSRYASTSKILDAYLYPLLHGRGKDHHDPTPRLLDSFAYPKWFPVPSEYEGGGSGGTKQARFACSGPSVPTFPPRIKARLTGRFLGGHLIWFDYSQIELRVAALLSNDPAMMQEYASGNPDLHGKTAKLMFGDAIAERYDYKAKYRQAGKTFNFRALFRGGAATAHDALMKNLGIDLPIPRINEIDAAFWARHRRLWEWQEELLDFVAKHGYYELPLIGQSRLFLGGRKARSKAMNEIVNLPVQAVAADIMLSAQSALWGHFIDNNIRAVVPANVYDAAPIECHDYDLYAVREAMQRVLPNPPYYDALCRYLGRTLPLEYEAKEFLVPKGAH